jgi:hypothetical protein
MRKRLSALLCLALSGCATTAQFAPIGNCMPAAAPGSFRCVDSAGKPLADAQGAPKLLPWEEAQDLVCFRIQEFKAHEETCHSP